MRKEEKYIFETEKDIKVLRAVRRFIGQSSPKSREADGISEEDAKLCSDFYDMLDANDFE